MAALLDKITLHSKVVNPASLQEIIQAIETSTALPDDLRRAFLINAHEAMDKFVSMTEKTTGAIELFTKKMQNWYDTNMERLSGSLKTNYIRRYTFYTALVVSVLLNADTIQIAQYLYQTPQARTALAQVADKAIADSSIIKRMDAQQQMQSSTDSTQKTQQQLVQTAQADVKTIADAHAVLASTLPIGWNRTYFLLLSNGWDWLFFVLLKILGIGVTILATMMGAPFWFDVLNKISNLRGSGAKPKVAEEEK